ncbi:MAG TPA: 5-(carboxyamino)imidazole ribonucleotide synthase [Actinomycetota bacterium]|nr:5-(carboxyamino)imidazole ribonucleotide synthase [Actinomycetota bacterium]
MPDLPPGTPRVGIIGGGQLARMSQQPAIALGVQLHVLADSEHDSASQVIPAMSVGAAGDEAAIGRLAASVDVVTFDHEHVPPAILQGLLAQGVAVYPGPEALAFAQDKAAMRTRLEQAGFPVPRWQVVADAGQVEAFAGPWPKVLKASRGGYDGKGVWVVADVAQAAEVMSHELGVGALWLVEELVGFTQEIAVQVARSPHGQAVAYPPVRTVQVDGICVEVVAPCTPAGASAEQAEALALGIAKELGVVGMLAVEMFDTPAGLVVNELAMRPHNSGHWTIEGAVTSQFENHLRAVLDLPLGDPRPRQPKAVMVNILGGELPDLHAAFKHVMARDPGLKIHLYGKGVRPGRKVGHVTALGDDEQELLLRARHAADYFQGVIDE